MEVTWQLMHILFTNFPDKKMSALRDVAPCIVVEVDRCFACLYCLHHQGPLFHKAVIFIVAAVRI
jgi:hypothetical protein